MAMRKRSWYHLITAGLTLCLFLASALPLWSQEPINLRIDNVDDSNFPQMQIRASVRNNNGVPVTGLTPGDFEITEDGTSLKPAQVQSITNPEVELAVALVIDISGSMRADKGKPLQDAKSAANAFLDTLTPDDQAAVIAFGDKVDLGAPFPRIDPDREHDFTYDKNALHNVVNFLDAKECAGTPLYDAAFKAVRMTAHQPRGNRAVILMTDGRDAKGVIDSAGQCREAGPGSEVTTTEDPIAEANRNNIPVFTIGLGENIDRGYLERLALRTGGTYQQTPDSAQLTTLYKNIAELLKQQYVLTYTSQITENSPPVTADGKHSLAVRATYGGAEAIDETKIAPSFPAALEPAPAATTGAGGTTAQPTTVPPTSEPPVAPTPTPPPPLEKNRGLVIAVGGLGALALLLLLVFALLRRRPSGEGEEVYEEIPTDLYAEGIRTPAASDSGQETPFIQPTPPTDMAGPMPTPAFTGTRPGGPAAGAKTEIIRKQPKSIGYFIVKEGRRRGTQLPLTGSRTSIGRGSNNNIALDDSTVSGNHAVVLLEDDGFYIQDIGSSNGTLVGGKEITKHKLSDGDEVTLGETVLIFKFTKLDG